MTMSATHAHRRGRDCFHVCFMFETLPCTDEPVLRVSHVRCTRSRVAMLSSFVAGCTPRAHNAPARGALRFPSLRATGSFGRFNHRFCISALACICERASFVRTKVAAGIAIDTVPLFFSETEPTYVEHSRLVECSLLFIQIYASLCRASVSCYVQFHRFVRNVSNCFACAVSLEMTSAWKRNEGLKSVKRSLLSIQIYPLLCYICSMLRPISSLSYLLYNKSWDVTPKKEKKSFVIGC